MAFCVPPHSQLLIPSSPFKPVCFLSVHASMSPPPALVRPPCSTPRSVCACRLLELQVLFFFWQRKTELRQAFVPPRASLAVFAHAAHPRAGLRGLILNTVSVGFPPSFCSESSPRNENVFRSRRLKQKTSFVPRQKRREEFRALILLCVK